MFSRRLIRGVFLGLFLLSAGAWGWSYLRYGPRVGYAHANSPNFQYMVALDQGTFHISTSRYCGAYPKGLFCQWRRPSLPLSIERSGFLGFYTTNDGDDFFHWSGIPMWFPTLFIAFALPFIWRKTRSKLTGGSFPVDVTAKPGDS